MNKIKKINKQNLLTFIPIIIFLVLMYVIGKVLLSTDDEVYRDAFNNLPTFFTWTKDILKLWSGRIPILALTNIFMHIPLNIFRISNAIIFTSVIVSINIIVRLINNDITEETKRRLLYVTFSLIFFVDIAVLSGGAFWLCGSLNYLWPFAFMLISIIPFIAKLKNIELEKKYYILFVLANFIACFSEQSGAVLIAFGAITMIYCIFKKIKPSKILIAHYIIISIITIFSLKAPGNQVRFYAEQTRWYPDFAMLSLGDKLLQGYMNLANHLCNHASILCMITALTASYLVIKNKKIKKCNKAISLLPVIYFGINSIPLNQYTQKIHEMIFGFNKFGFNNLYSYSTNLKIFFSAIILGIIITELIYIWEDKKNGIISAILYCAGLCSAMAMSLSPTIYASGNRTFFATDFIIILINTLLISEVFKSLKNKENQIWIVIVLLGFSAVFYMNIYNNWLDAVIW